MTEANPAGLPRIWRDPEPAGPDLWDVVWSHWDDVEADLAEHFGIDMWDGGWDMPWIALQARISALITAPMSRFLAPTDEGFEVRPIPATRLQSLLIEE